MEYSSISTYSQEILISFTIPLFHLFLFLKFIKRNAVQNRIFREILTGIKYTEKVVGVVNVGRKQMDLWVLIVVN